MPAVLFRNFSYAYQGVKKILDNVNLAIPKGAFVAITGASGAGKTTLCMAVSGIVPHYFGGSMAGEVLVEGRSTSNVSMGDMARTVGTVLDDYESQLVTMTVEEEIAFALENNGLSHQEIKARINEVCGWVGLTGLERREISSLSGGQRQRLAIAAVLATKADVLVLDEPASALDPEGAEELYALLADLNSKHGMTVIVVEHELSRVLAYVDQIIVLDGGKVACCGRYDEALPFLQNQPEFRLMVPSLWQVKFEAEETLDTALGNWRHEVDAVEELAGHLAIYGTKESRSA